MKIGTIFQKKFLYFDLIIFLVACQGSCMWHVSYQLNYMLAKATTLETKKLLIMLQT